MQSIAAELGAIAAQVLLTWVIREPGVITIPKAVSVAHVKENAGALAITLSSEHREALDRAFPPPRRKTFLDSA